MKKTSEYTHLITYHPNEWKIFEPSAAFVYDMGSGCFLRTLSEGVCVSFLGWDVRNKDRGSGRMWD